MSVGSGCLHGSQMWGEGAEKEPPFLPKCVGVGCRTKLYFSVEPGRRASVAGQSPVGLVGRRGPGGAERGRQRGSPAAPARASRPSLASREAAWRPAAAAPPAHAPLSNQNGSSPRPWAGGGTPALQSCPRAAVPTETREVAKRARPLARLGRPTAEGELRVLIGWGWGASSLGWGGADVEITPRRGAPLRRPPTTATGGSRIISGG